MKSPPPQDLRGPKRELFESPLDIPIVHALYESYKTLHLLVEKFPKTARYSLGQKCTTYLLDILEYVLLAAASREIEEKMQSVKMASAKLDTLKILIRLCKDCRCISEKQYQQFSSQLHTVGKMIGGWIKSIDQKRVP